MDLGERSCRPSWFKAQAEREAGRDVLPMGERFGQVVGIVITGIVIAFFVIHQTRPTGFFTDEFGSFQAWLFYLILVLGVVPMLVRLVTSRRNQARLSEVVSMAVFFFGGLYLWLLWPFDFAHFAEPLPRALEPALDWVTDAIARWVMGVGVVASAVFAPYTLMLYAAVRKLLALPPQESAREGPGPEPPKTSP